MYDHKLICYAKINTNTIFIGINTHRTMLDKMFYVADNSDIILQLLPSVLSSSV